jgi:CBS-domain-containing membrane protein
MNDTLFNLTAYQLMSRDVMVVPEHMSLRRAARLLSESHISGAPVVDETGRCVGVLSATDFVRRAGKDNGLSKPVDIPGFWADWCINGEIDRLPEEEVFKFMTKDPVTIRPATPLADLARQMVDGHIHRLIVVDVQERPIGVVSSTDILAAVARAALVSQHA